VTVTATDDAVRLVVEDTGQGMDEATRARAVEPFFTTKPRARGTGLGLATVHGIIEQAGGLLTIDSTPGKGTRVTIELPAAPAPAVQHERAPEAPPSALAPRAPLLVADDDDTVRHTIARLLRRAGFTVHAVADGREALAALEERPGHFGLVLTDVMMPGMGGKVLAAEIRARWPDLPVLFMTGYIQQRFDDIPDFEPTRDLITKPFSVDALVARVAERLQDRASVG
jgi:CheY-like chemotaxis protein